MEVGGARGDRGGGRFVGDVCGVGVVYGVGAMGRRQSFFVVFGEGKLGDPVVAGEGAVYASSAERWKSEVGSRIA